ncbi:hypothetical protein [Saccharothrix deserti]|uniref:hypothetical protein n=1 Tax=Saccharothrix deserti TaxID=2593674 RepID=UPI00131B7EDC|nr:hypothetical protein [Saccharothrix deserti]
MPPRVTVGVGESVFVHWARCTTGPAARGALSEATTALGGSSVNGSPSNGASVRAPGFADRCTVGAAPPTDVLPAGVLPAGVADGLGPPATPRATGTGRGGAM